MINLQKGQKVSLTKESQGLKSVTVGLGWDMAKAKFPLFGKKVQDIDCDASAILLDEDGKCATTGDVVYFANLSHKSGFVVHQGDNLTGKGEGDDEQIMVDLEHLPEKYQRIAFIVTIYKANDRKQHFGMVNNAFIRIVDSYNGNKELCKFNLSDDATYQDKTSMVFGELYRHNGEWKFQAVGEGLTEVGINSVINRYYK